MQIRNGDKELKKRLMLETILRDAPTHSCIDYCRKKITVSLRKLKGNKKNLTIKTSPSTIDPIVVDSSFELGFGWKRIVGKEARRNQSPKQLMFEVGNLEPIKQN